MGNAPSAEDGRTESAAGAASGADGGAQRAVWEALCEEEDARVAALEAERHGDLDRARSARAREELARGRRVTAEKRVLGESGREDGLGEDSDSDFDAVEAGHEGEDDAGDREDLRVDPVESPQERAMAARGWGEVDVVDVAARLAGPAEVEETEFEERAGRRGASPAGDETEDDDDDDNGEGDGVGENTCGHRYEDVAQEEARSSSSAEAADMDTPLARARARSPSTGARGRKRAPEADGGDVPRGRSPTKRRRLAVPTRFAVEGEAGEFSGKGKGVGKRTQNQPGKKVGRPVKFGGERRTSSAPSWRTSCIQGWRDLAEKRPWKQSFMRKELITAARKAYMRSTGEIVVNRKWRHNTTRVLGDETAFVQTGESGEDYILLEHLRGAGEISEMSGAKPKSSEPGEELSIEVKGRFYGYSADGKRVPPTWRDTAVASYIGLEAERATGVAEASGLTIAELTEYVGENWDIISWSHHKRAQWRGILRQEIRTSKYRGESVFVQKAGSHLWVLRKNALPYLPGPLEEGETEKRKEIGAGAIDLDTGVGLANVAVRSSRPAVYCSDTDSEVEVEDTRTPISRKARLLFAYEDANNGKEVNAAVTGGGAPNLGVVVCEDQTRPPVIIGRLENAAAPKANEGVDSAKVPRTGVVVDEVLTSPSERHAGSNASNEALQNVSGRGDVETFSMARQVVPELTCAGVEEDAPAAEASPRVDLRGHIRGVRQASQADGERDVHAARSGVQGARQAASMINRGNEYTGQTVDCATVQAKQLGQGPDGQAPLMARQKAEKSTQAVVAAQQRALRAALLAHQRRSQTLKAAYARKTAQTLKRRGALAREGVKERRTLMSKGLSQTAHVAQQGQMQSTQVGGRGGEEGAPTTPPRQATKFVTQAQEKPTQSGAGLEQAEQEIDLTRSQALQASGQVGKLATLSVDHTGGEYLANAPAGQRAAKVVDRTGYQAVTTGDQGGQKGGQVVGKGDGHAEQGRKRGSGRAAQANNHGGMQNAKPSDQCRGDEPQVHIEGGSSTPRTDTEGKIIEEVLPDPDAAADKSLKEREEMYRKGWRLFQLHSHGPRTATAPRNMLPQQAVATFKAWASQHADHPYPNEEEKRALSAETRTTLVQVTNWFINHRSRVWRPASKNSAQFKTFSLKSRALLRVPITGPNANKVPPNAPPIPKTVVNSGINKAILPGPSVEGSQNGYSVPTQVGSQGQPQGGLLAPVYAGIAVPTPSNNSVPAPGDSLRAGYPPQSSRDISGRRAGGQPGPPQGAVSGQTPAGYPSPTQGGYPDSNHAVNDVSGPPPSSGCVQSAQDVPSNNTFPASASVYSIVSAGILTAEVIQNVINSGDPAMRDYLKALKTFSASDAFKSYRIEANGGDEVLRIAFLDDKLSAFILHSYSESPSKASFDMCKNLLTGLKTLNPHLNDRLEYATQSISGWGRMFENSTDTSPDPKPGPQNPGLTTQ